VLAFYEFGDPAGQPVLYQPGSPESGLAGGCYDAAAKRAGVRWVSIDRPGFGRSDPAPRRTLRDWADDVGALADHLHLDRFVVVGESGGGPHALAVSRWLAPRVERTLLLAAMGPFDDPRVLEGMNPINMVLVRVGRIAPPLIRALVVPFGLLARHEDRFPGLVARLEASSPEPDRLATEDQEYALRKAAGPDAFRQGSGPAAHELALFARPWGFTLDEVTTPVELWHGRLDVNVPFTVAETMAAGLPDATLHEDPAAAHLVGFVHREEVMAAVTAHPR